MEQWKQIDGYENYEVSTEGRVRSLNYHREGRVQILQQSDSNGYLVVLLYKNKNRKRFYTHILVANAFIPNPQNKPTVNHINEDKHDNRVENLEWATQKEQNEHGTRIERAKEKQKGKHTKRVRCIELDTIYDSIRQASEETGCDMSLIVKVCKGKGKTCGGFHWEYVEE